MRPRSPREIRSCKLAECENQFEVTLASDKYFCCRNCARKNNFRLGASKAGLASAQAQSKFRRSKNETLFAEYCKEQFLDVKENAALFNGWDADVVIEDFKIAVLWNGKWHYEKITKKHSVEQVQNRDRIKCFEILRAGYVPFVVKDMGKHNEEFVKHQFNLLLSVCQMR